MLFSYKNTDTLNIKQASKYTGYTIGTIYTYCSKGEIPYTNPTGGKLQFDKKAIDKWLAERKPKGMEVNLSAETEATEDDVFQDDKNSFYIGMVDTLYGSDGELHICQGNKTVTFDATDLFHWLDAIVSTTMKQRKDSENLILENIKNALQDN